MLLDWIVVLSQFASAASPLTDRLRAGGAFTCTNQGANDFCVTNGITRAPGFTYTKPIALVIPKGLDRPGRLHLHLHGWRGVCEPDRATPERLAAGARLGDQLNDPTAVVIFPISAGRQIDHNGQLTPAGRPAVFAAFMTWAESLTGATAREWTVSAHSGAYVPLGRILNEQSRAVLAKIKAVGLMDATYSTATLTHLRRAAKTAPLNVFAVYVAGSSTEGVAKQIGRQSSLNAREVAAYDTAETPAGGSHHCEVPRRRLSRFWSWVESPRP